MKSRSRVLIAFVAFGLALGAGVARADRVVVEPPVFFPAPEFHFDNGYYRTNEGHYYHYDHDRDGWHYGRNHREGVRYEERHHHER